MIYRPIILAKMGERKALETLEADVHEKMIPIFVIPPRAFDYEKGAPQKETLAHISKVPMELRKARGKRNAYIDIRHLDEPDEKVVEQHLLEWLVAESATLGLDLIPLVDTDSSEETLRAAGSIANKRKGGVGFRIPANKLSITSPEVATVLGKLSTNESEIDLILDLESEVTSEIALKAVLPDVREALTNGQWRSVTVGGAAYPNDNPQGKGVQEVPRKDWTTYLAITEQLKSENLPAVDFTDYVISGTEPGLDIDPKFLSISSTFRYANGDFWIFTRGELFKGPGGSGKGGAAVPSALRQLVGYASYIGIPASQVHDWFADVIQGRVNGGNPTTWRRWGTYHHLRVASDQVASLSGL